MNIKYIIWNLLPIFIKKKIFKKIVWSEIISYWSFDLTDYLEKRIVIWKNAYIWENIKMFTLKTTKINIWKYTSIASWTKIITYNHWINYPTPHVNQWRKRIEFKLTDKYNSNDINIWNDVWIWFNCIILPWVSIWDWAVIWAWAIVSKSIEPYAVIVWNPWNEVKKRFNNQVIDFLKNTKWWDWTEERIKDNSVFFNTDLSDYQWDLTLLIK